MIISFIGGLMIGSGEYTLLSRNPSYSKRIAALMVLVGVVLFGIGVYTPSILY